MLAAPRPVAPGTGGHLALVGFLAEEEAPLLHRGTVRVLFAVGVLGTELSMNAKAPGLFMMNSPKWSQKGVATEKEGKSGGWVGWRPHLKKTCWKVL